jgi:hypothetical protein
MRSPRVIAPERTAVLVIDMQNFFVADGYPMANPHAQAIIPNVNGITAAYRRAGAMIAFTLHSFAGVQSDAAAPDLRQDLHNLLMPGSPAFALPPDIAVEEAMCRSPNMCPARSTPVRKAACSICSASERSNKWSSWASSPTAVATTPRAMPITTISR